MVAARNGFNLIGASWKRVISLVADGNGPNHIGGCWGKDLISLVWMLEKVKSYILNSLTHNTTDTSYIDMDVRL